MAAGDNLIYNSSTLTANIAISSMVTLTTSASNCFQGDAINFGTPRAGEWLAKLQGAFIAAPTAGGTIDLFMAWSSASNAGFPGGVTGTAGNYPGPSAVPNDGLRQLDYIGSLVACATGSTVVQSQDIGVVFAKRQWGAPVLAMRTSQVFSSQSASHALTFTDLIPQGQ